MKRYSLIAAVCALVLLGSCTPKQNLTYFKDNRPAVQSAAVGSLDWQIKIEPQDELVITVTSDVPAAAAPFNLPLVPVVPKEDLTLQPGQGTIQTYIVNKDGDINFPVLGKLHVQGLTTVQLAEELTRRISAEIEGPIVRVELINFKVNVMGEVQKPGVYPATSQRFTILDALASAEDLTMYGRRDRVTLIREEDGKITYNIVNLEDANLFNSPYYYLKQNDAIYVEPTESRKGMAEYNQSNGYKLQVISAIISGVSVIASLVIALTVK